MLSLIEIFSIIIIHWFADFVLQTRKQAQGKSKNWNDLLAHTFTYSLCWYLILFCFAVCRNHFNGPSKEDLGWSTWMLLFPFITFIAHTATDYFTSRLNSKLWVKGDVHNFFVSVGFDQVLHYIQLFLTYYLLKTA
jgi:membrane-bound acyltransferase YfiQ involved in biofilm formation